jgi:ribosome-binding protein aMBF1 (putative translation factor)
MPCGICSDKLPADGDFVTCYGCSLDLHYTCSGLQKSTHIGKSKDAKKKWRCVSCREKGKSTPPAQKNPEQSPFTFDMESLKREIRNEIRNGIREGLATIKEELTGEIKLLKKKVQVLEENVVDLTSQLTRLEQYGRNRNIEIDNVELIEGEIVEDIVLKVAQVLHIDLASSEIDAAHRLPSRKTTQPPKIIVQFVSRKKRDEFMSARRQLAIVNSQRIVNGNSKDRIYINDNLTQFYKELLWRTKNKAKELGYKFVWFKFEKVLVRKNETDRDILRICSFADIDKIE